MPTRDETIIGLLCKYWWLWLPVALIACTVLPLILARGQ